MGNRAMRDTEEKLDGVFLDLMLEEEFGDASAPDMRHRVLMSSMEQRDAALDRARSAAAGDNQPTRARMWWLAAAFLVSVSAVVAVYAMQLPDGAGTVEPQHGPEVPVSPIGPIVPQPQDPKAIRPKDVQHFKELLKKVQTITVVLKMPKVTSDNTAKLEPVENARRTIQSADELSRWVVGLKNSTRKQNSFNRLGTCADLRIMLTDGRRLICTVFVDPQPRLSLGLGEGAKPFVLDRRLTNLLNSEVRRLRRWAESGMASTVAELSKMPADLTRLECPDLREQDLPLLKRFRKLQHLEFAGVSRRLDRYVSDDGVEQLVQLESLRMLNLPSPRLTDAGLEKLADLTKLEELHLKTKDVTGSGFTALKDLPLKRLYLTAAAGLSKEGVDRLTGFQKLEALGLMGMRRSRVNRVLPKLASFPLLKELNLSDCRDLVDADLAPLSRTKLVSLNLGGCFAITTEGIKELQGLPSLRRLNLYRTGCDKDLVGVLSQMKKLEWVDLRNTRVTQQDIDELAKALPDCEIEWGGRGARNNPFNSVIGVGRGAAGGFPVPVADPVRARRPVRGLPGAGGGARGRNPRAVRGGAGRAGGRGGLPGAGGRAGARAGRGRNGPAPRPVRGVQPPGKGRGR